jgi:DNA-binding response OmpR family regulator
VKVLVVEDEVRLALALRRGLLAEGFTVDLAHDGEDGLHLALEGDYAVVVLDVMLPRLSGYRVCQRLRAANNWVPVLMLSAKDGEYDEADGLDIGADDYLTKPFSYVVLVARLRALLRRGAPDRPTVLAAGDLTLDPATRVVQRDRADISLTPREFALLEFLMRRRGEVVAKTEILSNVWDTNYTGDPNVVEVYVGYLRRKVDAPFG